MKKHVVLTILLLMVSFLLPAQNKKVAVMETKCDGNVNNMQKNMVRGGMEVAVANAPGYEGYDRTAFDIIMQEQNFQRSGAVDDSQIRKLGQMAGVQYVLVTEASTDGSGFFIIAKLLNVETGQFGKVVNTFCQASGQAIYNASNDLGNQLFELNGTTRTEITVVDPGVTTTTTLTTTEQYDVYKTINNYVLCGWQTTNYEDNAVGLTSLKESIKEWGGFRTGAILADGTGIVIKGSNGYSYTGMGDLYSTLKDKIKKYNKDKETISDVAFNSKGHYVIIRDDYGYGTEGLPSAFLDALKARHDDEDKIISVSLDETDNWAYATDKYYNASNSGDYQFMTDALEKFGRIYCVCITTKGIAVCCKNGVYFKGVPSKLVERLETFLKDGYVPKVVKFTDKGTCLITDGESHYTYFM